MKIITGYKTATMYGIMIDIELSKYRCDYFTEMYSRVGLWQISWHIKSSTLKTKVYPYRKFPFVTTINGTEYQSDKIESVLRLISQK